jgi:hypothetical protein
MACRGYLYSLRNIQAVVGLSICNVDEASWLVTDERTEGHVEKSTLGLQSLDF